MEKNGGMEKLREAFDAMAPRYDEERGWIIPDFPGFYAAAARVAASPKDDPAILDIGAGTGLLSEMLLETCPGATITLLDISEKMLDVARVRFRGREKIRFVVRDYRHGDLGGPFDVIISALSIHHLAREEKRDLYRRIHRGLGRGGVFVNADEVAGETEEVHRRNLGSWDDFLLGGPLPREEAEAIIRRRETFDRMDRLSVQLEWLRVMGFHSVKAVYENGCFAVFRGEKR
jgi:tRNA (cmo5U34)-methyltransferase